MKVKEVADLVGISVRTLHHYDAIGLLTPEDITESGYRVYSSDNIESLQHILFYKELALPLKEIKKIIKRPSFDQVEALHLHQRMIREERNRLDKMLKTIAQTIKYKRGEINMTNKEKFVGFNFNQNHYEKETRERYGDKAVNDSNKKIKDLSEGGLDLEAEFNAIYRDLANMRHEAPESDIAQEGIKVWYDFLNTIGDYSLDAFKGLGEMYVQDGRFTRNIDQFGDGLAVFMSDAMAVYADNN